MSPKDDRATAFALFAANYLKRWLERNLYDRAFQTTVGGRLRTLDRKTQYAIEFALNTLSVFFDRALEGDTALRRLVREVGVDAAPEISKRILNHAAGAEDNELVHSLLAMDAPSFVGLLDWLYGLERNGRERAVGHLSKLDVQELVRMANMRPDDRHKLFALLVPEPHTKPAAELAKAIDSATEGLRAFRTRLNQTDRAKQDNEQAK